MQSQPPPDIDAPREIAPFFRIGPKGLIFGSVCVAGSLLALGDALQYRDLEEGLGSAKVLVLMVMPFLIGMQGFLALLFMAGRRRAWWRTVFVLSPAVALSLFSLYHISTLYPHERWARNELGGLLEGPLPPSVRNVTLDYHCSGFTADVSWELEFDLAPQDWEVIRNYPKCRENAIQPKGTFFQVGYDPTTRICHLKAGTY